jgi:hypothetical protein
MSESVLPKVTDPADTDLLAEALEQQRRQSTRFLQGLLAPRGGGAPTARIDEGVKSK